jgi:hypothetical protein
MCIRFSVCMLYVVYSLSRRTGGATYPYIDKRCQPARDRDRSVKSAEGRRLCRAIAKTLASSDALLAKDVIVQGNASSKQTPRLPATKIKSGTHISTPFSKHCRNLATKQSGVIGYIKMSRDFQDISQQVFTGGMDTVRLLYAQHVSRSVVKLP